MPGRLPAGASTASASSEVAEPLVEADGESELIFAAIGTDVQELELAEPLDESAIAAVLASFGFKAADGRFLEGALRTPETQLQHPSSAILVEVFADRDRLRALHFELHGSEQENLAAVAAFTDLGHRLHARLGAEDDWTNSNQA